MIRIKFGTLTTRIAWVFLAWHLCAMPALGATATPMFGTPTSDILPAEQAFQVTVAEAAPDHVTLQFLIAPKTYLYQKAFRFSSDTAHVGVPIFPKAVEAQDPFLGKTAIYRHEVRIELPMAPPMTAPYTLIVAYQGCHEVGFCYPPQTAQLTIQPEGMQPPSALPVTPEVRAGGQPFDLLSSQKGWALLAFLGFGILLSFTPCVLPMVPILSAVILGEQEKHHPLKAFTLALAYVIGMATTYAGLGALVGSMGEHARLQWQDPWVLGMTAFFLTLFAAMLLHDRPQAFLSRLSGPFHRVSHALPRGEYLGVALMGMVASLVISPCVTPPLVGALTFITLEGNMWFGSLALFMLGFGMGLPLLAVTWLGTAILPKRGAWMQGVKHLLALMLLGMAIDLLSRLLPGSVGLMLYGVLAVCVGFWLKPFHAGRGLGRLWQGIAWIALLVGALWMVGGAMGHDDWRAPLRSSASVHETLPFTVVTTPAALDQALAEARDAKRPAFVDFYADWCVSCVHMERTVFTDTSVQALLTHYALIKVDLTETNADTKALMARAHVFGPPAYLFFDAQGHELTAARINGEMNSADFLAYLQQLRLSPVNSPVSPKN